MVRGAKGNSEIIAIPNRYKDTLSDLIDSSDAESLDWLRPIDKVSRNTPMSEGSPTELLEGDCLDKDISNGSLRLAPKTRNSQVYQRHDIAPLGFKSRRSQYGRVQRGKEDGKGQKGGESHQEGKIKPVVIGNSGFEISVYYYIIYGY